MRVTKPVGAQRALSTPCVIFDIDGTIVSAVSRAIACSAAGAVRVVEIFDGVRVKRVAVRPHALDLLGELRRSGFDVRFFTANRRSYATAVIEEVLQPARDLGLCPLRHLLCVEDLPPEPPPSAYEVTPLLKRK